MAVPSGAVEQVRIAYNNLLPPFAEAKDGKAVGLVVDIVRAAAERAGYSVEFLPSRSADGGLTQGRTCAGGDFGGRLSRAARTDGFQRDLDDDRPAHPDVGAPTLTPDGLKALAGKIVATPRTGPLAAFIQ